MKIKSIISFTLWFLMLIMISCHIADKLSNLSVEYDTIELSDDTIEEDLLEDDFLFLSHSNSEIELKKKIKQPLPFKIPLSMFIHIEIPIPPPELI